MSEENEHSHQSFFSFFAGPSKEELERHEMEGMAAAHEMRQFILSLDESQLKKLIPLIKMASDHTEAAFYYVGVAANILDMKYGQCMSCARKHDEELANMAAESEAAFPPKDSSVYQGLMDEYNMEQDDDGSDRVMCKNCGMWYINLKDRMLRSPDKSGCSGCVQKEQWG